MGKHMIVLPLLQLLLFLLLLQIQVVIILSLHLNFIHCLIKICELILRQWTCSVGPIRYRRVWSVNLLGWTH
jgi:hypothetical protein